MNTSFASFCSVKYHGIKEATAGQSLALHRQTDRALQGFQYKELSLELKCYTANTVKHDTVKCTSSTKFWIFPYNKCINKQRSNRRNRLV